MNEKFSTFDEAEFLDDEETITAYLSAALEDPNPDVFISALGDVARARSIYKVGKTAKPERDNRLHTALIPGANPRYVTIRKLVNALGIKLTVTSV